MASTFNNLGALPGLSLPNSLPAVPSGGAATLNQIAASSGLVSQGLTSPLGSFRTLMSSITSNFGSILSNGAAIPKRTTGTTVPRTTGNGPLKIVELDDFSSSHGLEIANTLTQDGDVTLEQYDISKGGGNRLANISSSLDDLITRARNGEQIDAINISQQNFDNSSLSNEVRRKIDLLSDLGVPVVVAAGNNGPGQRNALAANSSFNVASTTNGVLNRTSGLGNVAAEGGTTSFATANLSRDIARLHAQGYSNGQILNILG